MLYLRPVLLALLCGFAIFLITAFTKTPRHDREWQPHLARTPQVERLGGQVTVRPYRDWSYSEAGQISEDWRGEKTLRTDRVAGVWLVLEPHPGIALMAHTLVLFEFGDGDLVGLTIEARRQSHEKYDPLRGAFNRYELVYVWASPRDLLTRRVVHLDHDIDIYRLELTPGEAQAYLEAVLARTAAIARRPRFYNTLTSNCTNELAKSARLSWHPAFILTGGAAKALHGRDRIAGEDFSTVAARARLTQEIDALNGASAEVFNASLLSLLHERTQAPMPPS